MEKLENDIEYFHGFLMNKLHVKEIGERVKKDPTTISKEIKRNRFIKVSK